MKTISAFTRRPGLSRAAFRDYYETTHAMLGMSHFPFTRYVRNHVVEPVQAPDGIDCISEFYVDDWTRTAELTKAATGELFAEDEARFMDRTLIRSAVVEESVLQGPPREVDRSVIRRRLYGLDVAPGNDPAMVMAAVRAWGAQLAVDDGRRVTLDVVTGPAGDAFPYDALFPYVALISIWRPVDRPAEAPPLPPGAILRADILADVCESPPELIASRYAERHR